MALGASWGCFWLVLGAPEGLLRVVLASVKPMSTIKTAFPSFDLLFSLAVVVVVVGGGGVVAVVVVVVVVVVVAVAVAVAVAVVVAGNFSSSRPGGMLGAIE